LAFPRYPLRLVYCARSHLKRRISCVVPIFAAGERAGNDSAALERRGIGRCRPFASFALRA
jgi:hypothetical protein